METLEEREQAHGGEHKTVVQVATERGLCEFARDGNVDIEVVPRYRDQHVEDETEEQCARSRFLEVES